MDEITTNEDTFLHELGTVNTQFCPEKKEKLLAAMPPAGQSSSGRIIDGFDHGWSHNGRARYRGSQNLVIRARRRMEGLGRSGGDLGREGQGLGFHGARVSQS
ncbi:hypothetical protein DEO72_LG1g2206 [Vigna unguiculata]|uniref:Uncharacterized protein n=1 Tax=Vigna unguiculata TaxID=3917 RepID=A0A4D6KPG7_VIGUN|nr:hypothetical protein DEO72_LG1g2206 [Vigna unguiculata]